MYEDDHGAVQRHPEQITSTEYPFMFASLDAYRLDDGRPVEAKTASKFVAHQWGDADTDEIPQDYLIQLSHQMIVKSTTIGDLAALITLDDFRKYTIALDPELAGMIVEGLRLFWQRVENREPPEPTMGEEVERLFKRSVEQDVIADEATAAAYRELLGTRAALKRITEREAALKSDIQLFMQDKDTLIVDGAVGLTWKTAKGASRFDSKALQQENPALYAKYMTQSQGSRRFLIKGEKI